MADAQRHSMALEDELREAVQAAEESMNRGVMSYVTDGRKTFEGLAWANRQAILAALTELATLKQQLAESTPSPDIEGVRLAEKLDAIARDMDRAVGGGMMWINLDEEREFAGRIRRVAAALRTAQNTGRDEVLEADVVRLVIAARAVAFGECRDFADERYSELDAASEAFADRVPWENGDEA